MDCVVLIVNVVGDADSLNAGARLRPTAVMMVPTPSPETVNTASAVALVDDFRMRVNSEAGWMTTWGTFTDTTMGSSNRNCMPSDC